MGRQDNHLVEFNFAGAKVAVIQETESRFNLVSAGFKERPYSLMAEISQFASKQDSPEYGHPRAEWIAALRDHINYAKHVAISGAKSVGESHGAHGAST